MFSSWFFLLQSFLEIYSKTLKHFQTNPKKAARKHQGWAPKKKKLASVPVKEVDNLHLFFRFCKFPATSLGDRQANKQVQRHWRRSLGHQLDNMLNSRFNRSNNIGDMVHSTHMLVESPDGFCAMLGGHRQYLEISLEGKFEHPRKVGATTLTLREISLSLNLYVYIYIYLFIYLYR